MREIITITYFALGNGIIGFFENQLNTITGSILFALGVIMLVSSVISFSNQDK